MVGKDYDEFDLRDARTVGFWQGALTGAVGMLITCTLVGLYFAS